MYKKRSFRKFVFFFFALVSVLGHTSVLASDEESVVSAYKLQAPGTLRIGVYTKFAPYSSRTDGSGKFMGIDVDVGKSLAHRLGLNHSFIAVLADENMDDDLRNFLWKGHYLGGGVADVMMHVPYDTIYAKQNDRVKFFAPYQQEQTAIAYSPGTFNKPPSIVAAAELKLGVEIDTISDYYASSAYNGSIRDSVVRYFSVTKAVQGMIEGNVASVVAPKGELQGALLTLDVNDGYDVSNLLMVGMFRNTWQVGLAVRSGNDQLARDLNMAMKEMIDDGTLTRIYRDYGVTLELPR